MTIRIALVVQGLFELSDSIGYDCVGQYQMIRELIGEGAEVRIFAETVRIANYPDVAVESIERLWSWVEGDRTATVIYHYCDGWAPFEARFIALRCRKIVRWHNNTPPWLLASYSTDYTARSTRGFRNTLRLAGAPSVEFWVNSGFSGRQLSFLGFDERRIHVVYPMSKFIGPAEGNAHAAPLSEPSPAPGSAGGAEGAASRFREGPIRVLFVGRICPHKGHKHLVAACAAVHRVSDRRVELVIAGRVDLTVQRYLDEVRQLARDLGVSLRIAGEVPDDSLRLLYASSAVFLCLSEHEGFGLPVFEAMRMGLPVVAWRSTAVAELLRFHPLGVDSLDYCEIALSVLAACDPVFRDFVLEWQRKHVLSAYNAGVVAEQLSAGLNRTYAWPSPARPVDDESPDRPPLPRPEVLAAAKKYLSDTRALSDIPRDIADRLVTRHDIDSYAALLEQARAPLESDFFHRAMAAKFRSDRSFVGPILRVIRRSALSVQSGIVTTVAMLEQDLFGRADAIETQLRELRGAVEGLRAPERNPALSHADGAKTPSPATALSMPADEASFGETASLYDACYFNGYGQYSGYSCYTRDAVGPGQELAKTLCEIFAPSSVLDAGCAAGYTVDAFHKLGVEAFGCDVSEWAVKEARSPFVRRLDISRQPIDGCFDLVLAYDVIDHIAAELLPFALQNLWRATSGWLVIVPGLHSEGTVSDRSEPMHLVFHDRDWWRSLLERHCGVAIDRVATAALNSADHSREFGYKGRIFVLRKPRLQPESQVPVHGALALGARSTKANGQNRPAPAEDPAEPGASQRENARADRA